MPLLLLCVSSWPFLSLVVVPAIIIFSDSTIDTNNATPPSSRATSWLTAVISSVNPTPLANSAMAALPATSTQRPLARPYCSCLSRSRLYNQRFHLCSLLRLHRHQSRQHHLRHAGEFSDPSCPLTPFFP
ncbi:MetI-like protein [Dioscorea alata]|uniref:MetI-like protein n=1 Tax=Dioscorea alata TaxID=55571 RepID=A0ACB7WUC0_DIOAL|nr:MetI-like protein [Dioscorea alata]